MPGPVGGRATGVQPVAATRRGPATGWGRATGRGHGAASRQRPGWAASPPRVGPKAASALCHRPGGAWEAGAARRAPVPLFLIVIRPRFVAHHRCRARWRSWWRTRLPARGDPPCWRRLMPVPGGAGGGLLLPLAFPPFDRVDRAVPESPCCALATYRRWRFGPESGLGAMTGLSLADPIAQLGRRRRRCGMAVPPVLASPFTRAARRSIRAGESGARPGGDGAGHSSPADSGVLQEALRDRTPFGGFPWGRLAFSQSRLASARARRGGGAPLVTFGVAFVGGLVAIAVLFLVAAPRPSVGGRQHGRQRPPSCARARGDVWRRHRWRVSVRPRPRACGSPSCRATCPRLGLEFNAQRRAVLDNHVNATLDLARQVTAGQAVQPDWSCGLRTPADIDPISNADARDVITAAAWRSRRADPRRRAGRQRPAPRTSATSVFVWDPERGPVQSYVKRHPVPFAEYIPMRLVRSATSRTKVDLVRHDFCGRAEPGRADHGTATIGDVICSRSLTTMIGSRHGHVTARN